MAREGTPFLSDGPLAILSIPVEAHKVVRTPWLSDLAGIKVPHPLGQLSHEAGVIELWRKAYRRDREDGDLP